MANLDDPLHVVETLAALENKFRYVLKQILADDDFMKNFDMMYRATFDGALFYAFTVQPTPVCYVIEAFSRVLDEPTALNKRVEELSYTQLFEDIVERYTKTRKKPNPVLIETRAADLCYLMAVKIEAVPLESSKRPVNFLLLREFQVLQHIWESYRTEFLSNKCSTNQLIGFPMPFEFRNVDCVDYNLPLGRGREFEYYNIYGKLEPLQTATLSLLGSVTESRPIKSTLSYFSCEKVGPSLAYLMDLMMSQGKRFSISSALKVYDQLISRLIILHKYSVVHGDINPGVLNFGTGEAVNVLYINNFEMSVVVNQANSAPLPLFHDRFVPNSRLKEKAAHFVNDLEAAFYVFIYLLLGSLPWDARLAAPNEVDSSGLPEGASFLLRSDKCRTAEEKERFWVSSNQFLWSLKSIEMEYKDTTYRNFTCDIMECIYNRVKESISTCQIISPAVYSKDVFTPGSAPYNAYFGVRKIIASYFRFETRSTALKDPVWGAKTEILLKDDNTDRRMGWDMSLWCWNYLDASIISAQTGSVSVAPSGFKSTMSGGR